MFTARGQNEGHSLNWRGVRNRIFRVEWMGQTIASLCWIASTLAYGITSPGDWMQFIAATSWFLSNVAGILIVSGE
ncbi:MAG: hypothetical protein JJ956_00845 [Pseudomonadales bacterium]|nr:hypothetical protein [Pseudomonadales bacterium]